MAPSRIMQQGALQGQVSTIGEVSGKVFSKGHLKGTIGARVILKGKINCIPVLKATIKSERQLQGTLTIPMDVETLDRPFYEGDYTVVPKVTQQVLSTENKVMKDDVMILEIPYYATSNLTGDTVYIGGVYGD